MQLGFVIDHSQCIGCHACTIACKSENDVPVGNFRTWVKYTEAGEFPEVKRSFAVLRCNQCTSAPCVTICPTSALEKRPDGIVDVNPKACIGCKSCMQGCPYDALYINPSKGTAEKCHFCAHRTEQGLAPACAVVCPTEAIVPGDFEDPTSLVSRLKAGGDLTARKTEAGTGPNVWYRDAAPAGLDPLKTADVGGHLWADRHPDVPRDSRAFDAREQRALEQKAQARTTYDVAHPPLWGWKITGYLFAKALAAGVFLAGTLGSPSVLSASKAGSIAVPLLGLIFLTITSVFLVADLKRPERFLYIIFRPNWRSWLVRGTWILIGYGAVLTAWLGIGIFEIERPRFGWLLRLATILLAAFSAGYTGFLFGQAKGRVLWMQRWLWLRFMVQAGVAGAAVLLLLAPLFGAREAMHGLEGTLIGALSAHLVFLLLEKGLSPAGRQNEYGRHLALVKRGPFAQKHWVLGVTLGIIVPIALLVLGLSLAVPAAPIAALLVLGGLWVEKDVLVRAGQALPIS